MIDSFLDDHGCGGSLIAPDIVLTAGHCAFYHDRVEIGRHNRSSDNEAEYETFNIVEEIEHPLYDPWSYYSLSYDKLLVILDGESTMQPVRINRNASVPEDDSPVTAMGWGLTDWMENDLSPVLREVSLNTVNNTECEEAGDKFSSYEGLISPDMMCAYAAGKDTCLGDSGGPLIVKGSDASKDVQVGITSWGFECAETGIPGVYSRLSYDADWVDYTVCTYSKNPPQDFDCENVGNYTPPTRPPVPEPTLPPIPNPPALKDTINATVAIQFDEFPNEIGWKIDRVGRAMEEVVHMPAGIYLDLNASYEHTIPLHSGELYTFAIFDMIGDGIYEGGYNVSLGVGGERKTVIESGGEFGFGATHFFIASLEDRQVGLPSTFGDWYFLTLEMKFDDFPSEIGYTLISNSGASSQARRDGLDGTPYIIATKPAPFYHPNLADNLVTESLIIPAVDAEFTFILMDIAGDGMCCEFGNGSFALYNGPVDAMNLLISGDAPGSYRFTWTPPSTGLSELNSSTAPGAPKVFVHIGAWCAMLLALATM